MPEAKRPDPRRRTSRPAGPGKPGRAKPGVTSGRRERSAPEPRVADGSDGTPPAEVEQTAPGTSIRASIAASMQASADQRFGSTARRAAILAAVICVLTLTIAGPVRTYFSQRTEMKQLQASESQLRDQIADLESQKAKLADPVFIAAQARERLGFVMPGEIPYQVQLPAGATQAGQAPQGAGPVAGSDPWYTALWHTIADAPHGITPTAPPVPPPPAPAPPAPPPAPGG
ncbi:septum formation initiator family protein [Mycobacterium sp. PSTR-4-N]|uniref:FtsB family cell division protein n=1 Tax=Mycobacterium sp. PSTR-4-N TaxID=2917745 RepID=UPI001F14F006|nr:septum formation initiator family protein [Mycobacterium sp. PSTR-4-N]MCG7597323.1 septum formation initiator family protein [Mycobacterium sp. PSTR-4-N]